MLSKNEKQQFPFLGSSMHVGLTTNNMAELEAVRQGLAMAGTMGVKSLQLELDSKVILNWLTNSNLNYPTNILPLICDCRNGKCTCNTCSVRQMAVQMLWQSGGPISKLGWLCIVNVPLLFMYHIWGTWLAWGKLGFVTPTQL